VEPLYFGLKYDEMFTKKNIVGVVVIPRFSNLLYKSICSVVVSCRFFQLVGQVELQGGGELSFPQRPVNATSGVFL